jgi:hypothetical protein
MSIVTDQIKFVPVTFNPAVEDDDAPVGAFADANPVSVDRAGYDHALVLLTVGATDIAMASYAVYSGAAAASGASDSTYTKITGAELTGAALPSADDDNKVFAISIDLRALSDRYLAVDAVAGNGSTGSHLTINVILTRGAEYLGTAADQGYASLTRVVA